MTWVIEDNRNRPAYQPTWTDDMVCRCVPTKPAPWRATCSILGTGSLNTGRGDYPLRTALSQRRESHRTNIYVR